MCSECKKHYDVNILSKPSWGEGEEKGGSGLFSLGASVRAERNGFKLPRQGSHWTSCKIYLLWRWSNTGTRFLEGRLLDGALSNMLLDSPDTIRKLNSKIFVGPFQHTITFCLQLKTGFQYCNLIFFFYRLCSTVKWILFHGLFSVWLCGDICHTYMQMFVL